MKYKLITTCAEEIKPVLINELKGLGAANIIPLYKAGSFEASHELYYRIHLMISTANSILRVLKECSAKHSIMLHSLMRQFHIYIYVHALFANVPACQRIYIAHVCVCVCEWLDVCVCVCVCVCA